MVATALTVVTFASAVGTQDQATGRLTGVVRLTTAAKARYIVGFWDDHEGFIVSEHMEHWPQALAELGPLVAATGALKYRETVADGIESAPAAFLGLLKGKNFGKQLVRL